MKILYIGRGGGDYAATEFENEFRGQEVSDIIRKIENKDLVEGERPIEGAVDEFDVYDFEPTVYTFEHSNVSLIEFFREKMLDYDDTKHHNFYLETETIGE